MFDWVLNAPMCFPKGFLKFFREAAEMYLLPYRTSMVKFFVKIVNRLYIKKSIKGV